MKMTQTHSHLRMPLEEEIKFAEESKKKQIVGIKKRKSEFAKYSEEVQTEYEME